MLSYLIIDADDSSAQQTPKINYVLLTYFKTNIMQLSAVWMVRGMKVVFMGKALTASLKPVVEQLEKTFFALYFSNMSTEGLKDRLDML